MKKLVVIIIMVCTAFFFFSFSKENLRSIYSRPPAEWPRPFISGVKWTELGILPESPIEKQKDSLKHIIELGKALFFDPRISGSGEISCASCHKPELNWTDGKEKSIGHKGAMNKRNSPTIANSWFYDRLFWDGRSKDLPDQAFAPIVSESEMGSDMPEVMVKLRRIKGYKELFKKAYGDEGIDPDRMTGAIAVFEKTIVSGKSRFDKFLEGDKKALSNSEIRGLHLFRTKAHCMNCHNGPMFTDNQFHNNGFFYPGSPFFDKGYYKVSHKDEDAGKFKTPSLRDVQFTGPYMHDGSVKKLESALVVYKEGGVIQGDPLIQRTGLNKREIKDLVAFLKAISAPPVPFEKPVLPE